MRRIIRHLFGIAIITSVAAIGGCGGDSSTQTPAQYFKANQSSAMTPHGKVKTDNVIERDDKIEYSTEDGKRWRVGYSKLTDGTYQYDTPDEIEATSNSQ
ncbi:MAG: hypothetical protein LC104_15435 [Bacteroidales bacterium]|nr:hypothetical protein [Bacteroidales bacterium]